MGRMGNCAQLCAEKVDVLLLGIAFAIWVVVSAALHRWLSLTRLPVVPVMAIAVAVGLVGTGVVSLLPIWRTPDDQISGDTYYVVWHGRYWLTMSLSYLFVAACALLIHRLGRGWPERLLSLMFWTFHLGAGAVILPTLLVAGLIARCYPECSDEFHWVNVMSAVGAMLCFVGAAGVLLLALIAFGQSLARRWGN